MEDHSSRDASSTSDPVSQQTVAEGEGRESGMPESAVDIPPCTQLFSEWRKCTSAYNRFHQYYIHGRFFSCKEQKSRLKSCIKWRVSKNEEAREQLLRSFREEQAGMRTPDPVWDLRTAPPTDWTHNN